MATKNTASNTSKKTTTATKAPGKTGTPAKAPVKQPAKKVVKKGTDLKVTTSKTATGKNTKAETNVDYERGFQDAVNTLVKFVKAEVTALRKDERGYVKERTYTNAFAADITASTLSTLAGMITEGDGLRGLNRK